MSQNNDDVTLQIFYRGDRTPDIQRKVMDSQQAMTADSYSPTKEQSKENKMASNDKGPNNKDVVVDIEEPRHFLFKCLKLSILDKVSCFLAELIGTGLLVFLGCMGCVTTMGVANNHLQMIINFGLTVMMIIQMFGCVSGSHLNPSVTAAALVYKLVTPVMAVVYLVAQVLGAFVGFGLLKAVTPSEAFRPTNATGPGLCTTSPHKDLTAIQAVAVEFLLTMVLILVCCGIWDPRNAKHHDSVPIKFGLTIAALACAGGPWTGASMNPARSFGPAVWNGDFDNHWVYWVGPLLAGFLTSLAYKAVFWREAPKEKSFVLEEFPRDRNNA